jgi:hypothetical protein
VRAQAPVPAPRNGTTIPGHMDPSQLIVAPYWSFERKAANIFKLRGVDLSTNTTFASSNSPSGLVTTIQLEESSKGQTNSRPIHVAGFFSVFNSYQLARHQDRRKSQIRVKNLPLLFNHQGSLLRGPIEHRQFLRI